MKKYLMASEVTLRPSTLFDIDTLVALSKAKRLAYEKAQPQFWRYAGEEGNKDSVFLGGYHLRMCFHQSILMDEIII